MTGIRRRDLTAGGLAAVALPARAQGAPVEGTHYVRLSQAAPVEAPAGTVEVVSFFWYGSPDCYSFTPLLDAWAARLPPDVRLRRVPVGLHGDAFAAHQRLFYALQELGQIPALHRKVFQAIHAERARLDTPAEMATFAARQGLDGERFRAAYDSPATQAQVQQARRLSSAYKIDRVPAIGVQGRYFTTAALAGAPRRLLPLADHLIQLVRKA